MTSELTEFAALMQHHGVHAALAYLNRRTPHRYTGLFRFEGQVLRNEALVDGNQPLVRRAAVEIRQSGVHAMVLHQRGKFG
ncbi:MAG: hypothetical protein EOO57_14820 [Hymenobacter sp.]|nr:MAG: hypothetical protein EOO57_14820 [Hymenobacter sp.]